MATPCQAVADFCGPVRAAAMHPPRWAPVSPAPAAASAPAHAAPEPRPHDGRPHCRAQPRKHATFSVGERTSGCLSRPGDKERLVWWETEPVQVLASRLRTPACFQLAPTDMPYRFPVFSQLRIPHTSAQSHDCTAGPDRPLGRARAGEATGSCTRDRWDSALFELSAHPSPQLHPPVLDVSWAPLWADLHARSSLLPRNHALASWPLASIHPSASPCMQSHSC